MSIDGWFRRLRGAFRNALVWGAGFSALGFATFTVLRLAGIVPASTPWTFGLSLAVRMGIVGVVAGGAFSSVIRLVYHGRRLSDISWVRFTLAGGVVTGLFVPVFFQLMNVLTGDGMVPWRLVLDDGIWAAAFGAIAAGLSLKLAQRADALSAGKSDDQIVSGERMPPRSHGPG